MGAANREDFQDRDREMYRSAEYRDWLSVTAPTQEKKVKRNEHKSESKRD